MMFRDESKILLIRFIIVPIREMLRPRIRTITGKPESVELWDGRPCLSMIAKIREPFPENMEVRAVLLAQAIMLAMFMIVKIQELFQVNSCMRAALRGSVP